MDDVINQATPVTFGRAADEPDTIIFGSHHCFWGRIVGSPDCTALQQFAILREFLVAAERERCAQIVMEECFHEDAGPCCKGNGADTLARIRHNLDSEGAPAKPTPTWTREPPTVEGYWCKRNTFGTEIVLVKKAKAKKHYGKLVTRPDGYEGCVPVDFFDESEWFGPIEVPQ